jgi:Phage tail assembly chaperone proteins, E, or 41 or 14
MNANNPLQIEFEFTLPKGLIDPSGNLHRHGKMRLATAKDEIQVQKNRRVQNEPVYGVLVILSQVITQLGELTTVTPELLENLFTRDLAYLREFYNRINQDGSAEIPTQCPQCSHKYTTELVLAGE